MDRGTRSREVRAQLDLPATAAASPAAPRPALYELVSQLREPVSHPIVLRALIAVFAAAPVFPRAPAAGRDPWQSIAILGVAGAGAGTMYMLVTSDLLGRMPPGRGSFAGGILSCAQSLALIIANPLIGRAVDRLQNYGPGAITRGLWVIPGSLVWLLWRPPVRFVSRR